jgi:hypothetical protein
MDLFRQEPAGLAWADNMWVVGSQGADVLVEVDPAIGLRFVDLAERIETLIGVRADVVSRRAISPSHWALVEKELVDVA